MTFGFGRGADVTLCEVQEFNTSIPQFLIEPTPMDVASSLPASIGYQQQLHAPVPVSVASMPAPIYTVQQQASTHTAYLLPILLLIYHSLLLTFYRHNINVFLNCFSTVPAVASQFWDGECTCNQSHSDAVRVSRIPTGTVPVKRLRDEVEETPGETGNDAFCRK